MQIEMLGAEAMEGVARTVPFGETFVTLTRKTNILMRIKPVNFVLNSNLLNDVINRGDIFVVNVQSGTMYSMRGDTEIKLVSTVIKVL